MELDIAMVPHIATILDIEMGLDILMALCAETVHHISTVLDIDQVLNAAKVHRIPMAPAPDLLATEK